VTIDLDAQLRSAVASDRVHRNAPLAPLTTFKVGGTADWLMDVRTSDEARSILTLARNANVPICALGGGSNVLVSDKGIRGIVLRFRGGEVARLDERHIRADSGVTINGLVRWTITHGAAGLQAWAGTPGTVGGAVYGNAHFKGRLISELVTSVALASRAGDLLHVDSAQMEFGYDYSRLHRTGEMVVSADFRVTTGDPAALRTVARESLAFRKRTQPLESASAGCIFQNPNPATDKVPEGIPPSAGALVDRAGLKGAREGHAVVSPTHGNFIVNEGGATAADIRRLIARCKATVRDRFGVDLREEIVYLGED
jgi:UDP-N-acetylmuramate dehydrogenase